MTPLKTILRNILWVLGGIAVVAVIVYAFLPAPVSVDVGTVSRGLLRVTVDEDGKTRVKERFVVSAPLAGRLQRIGLKPGAPVEAGQTLLAVIEPADPGLLDDRERARSRAAVSRAEAARDQALSRLERAKRDYENARKDLLRIEPLIPSHGVSQQEADATRHRERLCAEEIRASQFAVQMAEFELEQARAVLSRANPSPGDADAWQFAIRSPVTGRVLHVHQESTIVVTPGQKLIEVGDPREIEVEVDLLSADAVRVPPRAKVFLEHWGGSEPLLGVVRVVEPFGITKTSALGVEEQRVNVIVDFLDPPEKRRALGDGYRVEARVVVWEKEDVLKVPEGALFPHGGGSAVWVVENKKAVLRPVQVGQRNGLEAEVLGGLREGETVIIHPGDKVKDGVAVTVR